MWLITPSSLFVITACSFPPGSHSLQSAVALPIKGARGSEYSPSFLPRDLGFASSSRSFARAAHISRGGSKDGIQFSSGPTGNSRLYAVLNDESSAVPVGKTKALPEDGIDSDTPSIDWKRVWEQTVLFRQMATPYYKESSTSRWLLAGVLGLTLANSGVSVLFSYLGKDFWNTLAAKDVDQFYAVLAKYLGALAVGAPIATLYAYQRQQLAVHWREWMTARTFDLYRTNQVYYKLERDRLSIDNPDQRITEDVRSFTTISLSLLITCLTSIIDLASFALILWGIDPQLFLAIIAYAGGGTIAATLLGKSLVRLNFQQLRREADLRYALVRLRDNSESIAFYAGEDLEGRAIEQRLERAMNNRRNINAAQRNLEFFTNSYKYLVQILPVAVVAPRYFAGAIELGTISQAAGAFNHILSDLSIIINQFETLSSFSAGIERLSSFYEAMRDVDVERNATSPLLQVANTTSILSVRTAEDVFLSQNGMTDSNNSFDSSLLPIKQRNEDLPLYGEINLHRDMLSNCGLVLKIESLDLVTPDQKRVLIRNLNFHLNQGEHLLIVGSSGVGKSSLLRAIAGLWTAGNGAISRPVDEDVYFLPQRPYCTVGSLKDQLLYPSLDTSKEEVASQQTNGDSGNKIVPRSHWLKQTLTDDDLVQILAKVDLLDVASRAGDGDPVKGLSVVVDWSNILSLGEQQRLAFGRLLVNRPSLIILDEATSALDLTNEARMYNLLQDMAKTVVNGGRDGGKTPAPGLTYISVGHRPSLVLFHNKKLRLGGELADHELSVVEKSTFDLSSAQTKL